MLTNPISRADHKMIRVSSLEPNKVFSAFAHLPVDNNGETRKFYVNGIIMGFQMEVEEPHNAVLTLTSGVKITGRVEVISDTDKDDDPYEDKEYFIFGS